MTFRTKPFYGLVVGTAVLNGSDEVLVLAGAFVVVVRLPPALIVVVTRDDLAVVPVPAVTVVDVSPADAET